MASICFEFLNSSQERNLQDPVETKSESTWFPIYTELNLLGHAQLEELHIGSQCGGHGLCGKDRIQVIQGMDCLSPPTEIENKHLGTQLLSQGWRLACQCWPNEDQSDIYVQVT